MRSVRCFFGIHDYKTNFEERRIICERCNKINHYATIYRLRFEKEAYERVLNDIWDEEFAEEEIKKYWEEYSE